MSRQEKISSIKNCLSSQLDDIAKLLVNNQDVELRTSKDGVAVYAVSRTRHQDNRNN